MRLRHAFVALALACGVALAAGAGLDETSGRAAPLLAVAHDAEGRWLVRLAPESLRPLPGRRLRLGAPLGAWAQSPDGGRLAAVTGDVLELIDTERMRVLGRVRTSARGSPAAVAWPRRDRLWIVLVGAGTTTVVTVDPLARRVLARRRLTGGPARLAASPQGPVLLLAPPAMIGPTSLAAVDAAGAATQLALDGMSAGLMPTQLAPSVERVRMPALAVEPDGRRAYVVSSRPYAFEIDVRQRRVSGHRLIERTTLVDRLRELLEPSAEAHAEVGPVRQAAWIDDRRIALSGYDADALLRSDGGVESDVRPAGLSVIDTRDWSLRTVDERASDFVAAHGLLVATGPEGLTAYTPDGDERFSVLDGRRVEIVASAGSYAYVRTPPDPALHVVDLEHERVIGRSAADGATLLVARGSASAP